MFSLDNGYYKVLLDSDWYQRNIRSNNNPDPRYQWEKLPNKRELFQVHATVLLQEVLVVAELLE